MLKVNIHEAKTHLSRYAKRVKAGETVLLCDRNRPFAEIRPLKKGAPAKPPQRRLGRDARVLKVPADWDSPATNAEVAGLFGLDPK